MSVQKLGDQPAAPKSGSAVEGAALSEQQQAATDFWRAAAELCRAGKEVLDLVRQSLEEDRKSGR
jgi:TfoX/Sxy family transcriptional regulator of competence genes